MTHRNILCSGIAYGILVLRSERDKQVKEMEMDKRWCEMCNKSDYAAENSKVQWYLVDGSEMSLCARDAKLLREALDSDIELI